MQRVSEVRVSVQKINPNLGGQLVSSIVQKRNTNSAKELLKQAFSNLGLGKGVSTDRLKQLIKRGSDDLSRLDNYLYFFPGTTRKLLQKLIDLEQPIPTEELVVIDSTEIKAGTADERRVYIHGKGYKGVNSVKQAKLIEKLSEE